MYIKQILQILNLVQNQNYNEMNVSKCFVQMDFVQGQVCLGKILKIKWQGTIVRLVY